MPTAVTAGKEHFNFRKYSLLKYLIVLKSTANVRKESLCTDIDTLSSSFY